MFLNCSLCTNSSGAAPQTGHGWLMVLCQLILCMLFFIFYLSVTAKRTKQHAAIDALKSGDTVLT